MRDELQVRTRSIRMAHDNINKTLKVAEVILAQFDLCRQVYCGLMLVFADLGLDKG